MEFRILGSLEIVDDNGAVIELRSTKQRALLASLLVNRNEVVSAWFPMLLTIYPVWETLFSIYRKKILRGRSADEPDGLHLHMLVYKRLIHFYPVSNDPSDKRKRNALTSPYLWALTSFSAVPAVLFWDNTPVLMGFAVVFVVTYCKLYWRIVKFQTPKWLILNIKKS